MCDTWKTTPVHPTPHHSEISSTLSPPVSVLKTKGKNTKESNFLPALLLYNSFVCLSYSAHISIPASILASAIHFCTLLFVFSCQNIVKGTKMEYVFKKTFLGWVSSLYIVVVWNLGHKEVWIRFPQLIYSPSPYCRCNCLPIHQNHIIQLGILSVHSGVCAFGFDYNPS